MVATQDQLNTSSSDQLPLGEVEQLVRAVLALWRQHRRPIAAVGVRGPLTVPLARAREQIGAALAAQGITHADVALAPGTGPFTLEVVEFAP